MSLKRGKFSLEEERLMCKYAHNKTHEEIAKMINRTVDAVEGYLIQKGLFIKLTDEQLQDKARCLLVLHHQAFWPEILLILEPDEVTYFENSWFTIYKQLNEDVSPHENMMMKDWFTLEIKKQRMLKEELVNRKRIKELAEEIEDLQVGGGLDPDIPKLIEEKALREATISNNVKLISELSKQIQGYSEKLKADRKERRDIQQSSDTWWGYLQLIREDPEFRQSELNKAELGRIAQEKATKDLMELTEYIDGTVDRPLLNDESIQLDEEGEIDGS